MAAKYRFLRTSQEMGLVSHDKIDGLKTQQSTSFLIEHTLKP